MMNILFVDDEKDILKALEGLYLDDFPGSFFCSDAEAALQMFVDKPGYFNLIVSDYRMPGTDGVKFYHELRKLNKDIRFLFYSAFVDQNLIKLKENDFNLGVVDKPNIDNASLFL